MTVEWLVAARSDLARIFAFNVARSEAYAKGVDTRLIERAAALATTPRMGRPLGHGGLRLLPVIDIQYVITSGIMDDGRVVIFRVHHAREDRQIP